MLKLSPGQAGDAPQGRELLEAGGPAPPDCLLIMDSAYEGDETLRLARQLGYTPIVPPNPNRLNPWNLDRVAYRRRNEIERLFRRPIPLLARNCTILCGGNVYLFHEPRV